VRVLVSCVLSLLTLTACDSSVDVSDTSGPGASVLGELHSQGGARWQGVEVLLVDDADGEQVCRATWELGGVAVEPPCPGCVITLEATRWLLEDEADCEANLKEPLDGSLQLAFVQRQDRPVGEVLIADGDDWSAYASGLLESGTLAYRRSIWLGD